MLNTYQNGGYWHTASGWLIEALWNEDRSWPCAYSPR